MRKLRFDTKFDNEIGRGAIEKISRCIDIWLAKVRQQSASRKLFLGICSEFDVFSQLQFLSPNWFFTCRVLETEREKWAVPFLQLIDAFIQWRTPGAPVLLPWSICWGLNVQAYPIFDDCHDDNFPTLIVESRIKGDETDRLERILGRRGWQGSICPCCVWSWPAKRRGSASGKTISIGTVALIWINGISMKEAVVGVNDLLVCIDRSIDARLSSR